MDKSSTRRGKACWYTMDNVGLNAIYDAFLTIQFVNQILDNSFANHKCRSELLNAYNVVMS